MEREIDGKGNAKQQLFILIVHLPGVQHRSLHVTCNNSHNSEFSQRPYEVGAITIPFVQMRKLKYREVKQLVKTHKAGKRQSQARNSGSLAPEPEPRSTVLSVTTQ